MVRIVASFVVLAPVLPLREVVANMLHASRPVVARTLRILQQRRAFQTAFRLAIIAASAAACGDTPLQARTEDGMVLESGSPAVALDDNGGPILAKPLSAVELADGRVLIADASDRDIKIYDATGMRTGVLGRRGEGPNEFRTMGGMVLVGQSVIALDNSRQLLNRFDATSLAPTAPIRLTIKEVPLGLAAGNSGELLVPLFPVGASRGNLVMVIDTMGKVRGGVLKQKDYFNDNPWLIQRALPMAAASGGLVFAAAGVGVPELMIYDADGKLLATVPLALRDPSGTRIVASAKTLRGDKTLQEITALPGGDVIHGAEFLYAMAALPDSAVALVFRVFDVVQGVDAVEAGELAIVRKCPDGWRLSNAVPFPGLLAGTATDGALLSVAYADSTHNRYHLLHLTPRLPTCGGE